MGSKKLKRKKLKCKKSLKSGKNKKGLSDKKSAKSAVLERRISSNSSGYSRETSDVRDDRLPRPEKHSRGQSYLTNVHSFVQIREKYFKYLQRIVNDNYKKTSNESLAKDILEKLALELEQHALLACMQTDIYQKSMTKIICDIKQCSHENITHTEVKKLLSSWETATEQTDTAPCVPKIENLSPVQEEPSYPHIPTITSTRNDAYINGHWSGPDYQLSDNNSQEFFSQSMECLDGTQSSFAQSQSYFPINQDSSQSNCINSTCIPISSVPSIDKNGQYIETIVSSSSQPFFPHESLNHVSSYQENTALPSQTSVNENSNNWCSAQNPPAKPVSRVPPQPSCETDKLDPILASRNQLQKSVDKSLDYLEKVNLQKIEDKERAELVQILEGDDSLDDRLPHPEEQESLSDQSINEEDGTLAIRLQKMRQIFGMEEEPEEDTAQKKVEPTKQRSEKKVLARPVQTRKTPAKPTIWRHEKNIHMYKLAMVSSEMTIERRFQNKLLILELFGEDSDEEHEEENRCEKKYLTSCMERISSWVVKYLMPFYNQRRIFGRSVFKTLGQKISEAIVQNIQYPDEWSVKYFVSRYFPQKKKYTCEADVRCFQIQ